MIEASRRSVLTGVLALVAAPAIIKVASLMPVNASLQPGVRLDVLYGQLTLNMITREAVRRFTDSNRFLREMNKQLAEDVEFVTGAEWGDTKIGSQLHIRLLNDYQYIKERRTLERVPQIPAPLALAAAAVAIAPEILTKPVTRRFWSK